MQYQEDISLNYLYSLLFKFFTYFWNYSYNVVAIKKYVTNFCKDFFSLSFYLSNSKTEDMVDKEVYIICNDNKLWINKFEHINKHKNEDSTQIFLWDPKSDEKKKTPFALSDLIFYYEMTYNFKGRKRSIIPFESQFCYIVLTDIVQSTCLWNKNRFKMAKCIVEHDRIAHNLIKNHNGIELRNEGDSFLILFYNQKEALNFAIEFYYQIRKINYDNEHNIGIKIAINYGKINALKKSKEKVCACCVKDIYEIISHTPRDIICINNINNIEKKENFMCIH